MTPKRLSEILIALDSKKISSKQAKEVFEKSVSEKEEPSKIIENLGEQISDEGELETLIDAILTNNPGQVEAYHNGKTNLFQFFVGQVMKETKEQANPVKTQEILSKKLN